MTAAADQFSSDEDRAPLPTVRDVLALPEVEAGEPELIVGETGLDREVRWAHVVAGSGAAALLDGGELILTTGAGWPTDPGELTTLSDALVSSGVAAVALELGGTFASAPDALVAACEAHGTPLIVLHREVRFVQITQRVHQHILAAQTAALEARTEVHAMLTELGLNRSPVDYVIERLAVTLQCPVVLEGPGHDVIAWASGGAGVATGTASSGPATGAASGTATGAAPTAATSSFEPEDILAEWARADGHEFPLPEGWVRVPVEAHGTRWGQLTALPGAPHPAGRRTVLELGAFALALGRLADTSGEQWLQFRSKRLFDVLLGGRYRRDTELSTQLAAGGLPVEGRILIGATLAGTGDFGSHESLERAILETALRRAVAPEGRALIAADPAGSAGSASSMGSAGFTGSRDSAGAAGLTGSGDPATDRTLLLALLSFPEDDPRVQSSAGTSPPLATRLARELDMLLPSTTPRSWRAHLSLGVPGRRIHSLTTAIERVRAVGHLPPEATVGRVAVQQAERQPLAYLVRGLATAPEMQEFVSETLGPLIAHDRGRGAGHSGDLLRVLEAYTAHPTNRSLAAQTSRLSRSVFYQRLALIEDLLRVDLTDGITIATLTVALLARGSTGPEFRDPAPGPGGAGPAATGR